MAVTGLGAFSWESGGGALVMLGLQLHGPPDSGAPARSLGLVALESQVPQLLLHGWKPGFAAAMSAPFYTGTRTDYV